MRPIDIDSGRAERSRLRYALVASYRVAKAYQTSVAVTTSKQELRWLQEGLCKVLARTYDYKRQLDAIQKVTRINDQERVCLQVHSGDSPNRHSAVREFAKTTVMTEPDVARALRSANLPASNVIDFPAVDSAARVRKRTMTG